MGINLQVLGLQSIPRLARKLGVDVEFPTSALSKPLCQKDFAKLLTDCERILKSFFEEYKMSWWDVYCNSDVGLERMALAQEMQINKCDTVLDVGCGRGYFSIAASRMSRSVVCVDLMDGPGRCGWWRNLKQSIHELNLANRVLSVKSDARRLPFKSGSFTLAASVHAIRNFQNRSSIETTIKEMKRVIAKGGRAILVESLPIAKNKAQEAHLEMFRCKVKYTWGELDYLPKKNIIQMVRKAGFRKVETKELEYDWSAAPPTFCIDDHLPSLPNSERKKAKETYDKAKNMINTWGEASPPALLVKAEK